jgi:hypothetical protein
MERMGRSPSWASGQAGHAYTVRRLWLMWAVCSAFSTARGTVRADEPAAAQASGDMLTLEPGATCLERERLLQRVAHWREHASVDPGIRVHVRGDPHEPTRVFFSVVRDATQPTERVLDNAPTDCDQLHSAVALSVALAIDAIMSGDHKGLPPLALPKSNPPPMAAIAGTPRRRPQPSMSLELDLLLGASVGVITDTAAAALPRLQFAPLPWLAFALAGIATRDQAAIIAGTSGQFSVTLLAGGVDACVGGETVEKLSFFMCAGGRGGAFTTQGSGFDQNYRRSTAWWAVAASGQARVFLVPWLAIGIGIETLVALADRELVVTSGSQSSPAQTRSVSRVGLSVAAGPVFRFF